MKLLKLLKFCLIILIFIFTGCESEDIDDNLINSSNPNVPETFSQYFGNDISRDFLGQIIDENHNPLSAVTISIGSDTAITDDNGVFIINNAEVKERFAYIKAEKPGYIHGSRSLAPSEGVNKVSIMLVQDNVISTINSGSAEMVSLPNGASVNFDGNFVKPDGTAYTGSVDVIMHHLDPANEDMRLQMPGMLYAENQDGAERMLQTFGMLAVELRGEGGEDLNLAEGSTSEITIPLDSSLLSTAPQTIPLWYFDEDYGYWKEEGQATLQGNAYVGDVSHFSFWNCDVQAEASNICINVLSDTGKPLSNLSLSITSVNYGTNYGVTNANGVVCGFVPSGETLELEINLDNHESCASDFTFNEIIGPFSGDDIITINLSTIGNEIIETVTGVFEACDGSPVVNGYIELNYNNTTYVENVEDGGFEFNIVRCNNDNNIFSILGYDYDNVETTGEINYTFTTPVTDLGVVSACDAISEFISLSLDSGHNEVFYPPFNVELYASNLGENTIQIYSSNSNQGCFFLFGVLNDTNYIGVYDGLNIHNENDLDTGFALDYEGCFPEVISVDNLIYNVSNFGNPGEYIDMNISGSIQDTLSVTHNVTGTIHVLRYQ